MTVTKKSNLVSSQEHIMSRAIHENGHSVAAGERVSMSKILLIIDLFRLIVADVC